jgi:hypothetical protein
LYYIKKKKEATGTHFSTNNHSNSDMRVQIIEKVIPNTTRKRINVDQQTSNKETTGLKQK